MLRGCVLFIALASSACATSRPQKMSLAEALAGLSEDEEEDSPRAVRRPPSTTSPRPASSGAMVASTSPALAAALVAFAARARQARATVPRGARMPLAQAENWERLNAAMDDFLRRAPERTSSFDLVRARVALEAELELDARAYGDFPAALAEDVLSRVTRIGLRMAQVRRLGVKTHEAPVEFRWPVSPVSVTSLFGRRLHPVHRTIKLHFGVDLAASEGQRVLAAAGGTVLRAEWNGAHGLQVELQHPGGVLTRYSHLSEVLVEPGAIVKAGDVIGFAGSTGMSTGPHLHFELWRGGKPMDPLDELREPGAELLPVASL